MLSPKIYYIFPSVSAHRAFTLVELLVALALSLILLIGITELFSRVGGIMNETQATLNMTGNLDAVERLLRTDLSRIPPTLPKKPYEIEQDNNPVDNDGYLEITEGPNWVEYVNSESPPESDSTAGDVDDIIGFTAVDTNVPFRGLINGVIAERESAEIIWFVRGNTLYRRVRLIDHQSAQTNNAVNSIEDLALWNRRFGHDSSSVNTLPFPLYNNEDDAWYHLRMPTLEETLHTNWDPMNWRTKNLPEAPIKKLDLWTQPHSYPDKQDRKSGSLMVYVAEPRHPRAGEDVVLTNVLSFDIKVWDSKTKDYVDLGTNSTEWDSTKANYFDGRVWDSWTTQYSAPPPFTKSLSAIRITIRCFDPASSVIKQISIVHKF